jgi:hypothetical protein
MVSVQQTPQNYINHEKKRTAKVKRGKNFVRLIRFCGEIPIVIGVTVKMIEAVPKHERVLEQPRYSMC